MDNRVRIQRVSRRYKVFFASLVVLIPIGSLLFWLCYNDLPRNDAFVLQSQIMAPLSLAQRLQLFAVSLIPTVISSYGFYMLSALFALYEKNIVFSADNVRLYRRLGWVAIVFVLSNLIYVPLCGLLLSLQRADHTLTLSLGLRSIDLLIFIIGIVVLLIAWVMEEAHRLEEEQAYTV